MSDRDKDEIPAVAPAESETGEVADPPAPSILGPQTPAVVNLAAVALEAGNFSAISDIAKSITALNRPALMPTPDWQRQFMPALEHTKFDVLRQFDVGATDIAARTHGLLGLTSPAAGLGLGAAAHLRGVGDAGAGGAFTRALDGIAGQDLDYPGGSFTRALGLHHGTPMHELLGGHLADAARPWAQNILGDAGLRSDYGSHFRDLIDPGPGSVARWLDTSVPRVDMAAWSRVVGTASAVSTMHDTLSAAARAIFDVHASVQNSVSAMSRAMFDVGRTYQGINDLIAPALRGVQFRLDEINRLTPIMQSALAMQHSAAALWSTRVTDLMQGWSVLSDLGHHLAGRALHLAIRTRDALIYDTDRDAVRQAVIDFMRRVLGYTPRPSEARIEAVTSALLDDSWLPTAETSTHATYNPRDQLRDLTRYQHGLWLPLPETKRRGRLIASLEKPDRVALGSDGGSPARPMDRLQAAEFIPEREPITHPVLKRVLDPLAPIEQEIVMARFCDGARTWADAATMCGRPDREGETVRRKFLKLKNAELQRLSA